MQNKVTLIIGAGQLGGRHLQGLLKSKVRQTIYVLDPSKVSLDKCRLRESEVQHEHVVVYTQDWSSVPHDLNLVIISTNANVRSDILEKLLTQSTAENIVLEKVLFQSLAEYDKINELASRKTECKFWVNHPRRESEFYQKLKSRISDNTILSASVYGEDWGLGCNSLHFIDMLSFIMGSDLELLDCSMLDKDIMPSKREGFIEFTGSVNGRFKNGTFLNIVSNRSTTKTPDVTKNIYINLSTGLENILITENPNSCAFFQSKTDNFNIDVIPFSLRFQSDLTTDIATSLLTDGECMLPSYTQAQTNHEIFIGSLLKEYNKINNSAVTRLPIT